MHLQQGREEDVTITLQTIMLQYMKTRRESIVDLWYTSSSKALQNKNINHPITSHANDGVRPRCKKKNEEASLDDL